MMKNVGLVAVACIAVMFSFGCGDDDDATGSGGSGATTGTGGSGASGGSGAAGGAGGAGGAELPFGSDMDVQMAAALWTEMNGYENWSPLSTPGFVQGAMPHAMWQQRFVNTVGEADPTVDGTIIVKANYMAEDVNTLAALTVMQKIAGFNPDEADWFWANFAPDGTLNENPDGVPLAGKIGKGGTSGCIPCHSMAMGGDFIFDND